MTLFDQFDTQPAPQPDTQVDLEHQFQEQLEAPKEFHPNVCQCKPMGPSMNRIEIPVSDSTDRTCWACFRPVRIVADVWYENKDRNVCLCADHKDYEGRHGGLADPKFHPKGNASQVARLLRTATPRRPNRSKAKPQGLRVSGEEELDVGEVTPEVAEFLRKMGKL